MGFVRRLVRERIGTFRLLLIVRALQWPIRAALGMLVRRMPRDGSLVLFGATSDRFADNPAYAFLGCSTSSSLRCVWVSGSSATVRRVRRLGLEAEHRWHPRGVWRTLRAGWFVYGWGTGDINRWLGDGARTFNLWHGVGVKRIQRARQAGAAAAVYSAPEGSVLARLFADDRHVPDLLLSTSPQMTEVLAHAFAVPAHRCLELGYPRNDHLVRRVDAPEALTDRSIVSRLAGRRVVGYFPTFRDDSMSVPGGVPVVREVAATVAAQGAILLFKAHDATSLTVEPSDSLVVLPAEADLNAYLGFCDVLVTDYSSVASDFLLLDRPIVLFIPDLDSYRSIRGFALDPRRHLPGLVTHTAAELHAALRALDGLPLPERLDVLKRFYWADARGGAADGVRRALERRR